MAWEYITAAFGSQIISGDNKSDTYKMYLKILNSDLSDEAKKEVRFFCPTSYTVMLFVKFTFFFPDVFDL